MPTPNSNSITHLAASGYIRIEREAAVVLLDVAPVGPDYLPAHGHADTLSFELSLFAQRVLVNSGTSLYGTSGERLRQRGTAAHNTVLVEGEDSSEVWGGFRVGRRARPFGLEVDDGATPSVSCSHDGYSRLHGGLVHRRQWVLGEDNLIVADTLTGGFAHAEARFHLHPDVSLEAVRAVASGDAWVLVLPHGQRVTISVEGGTLRADQTTWHPEFGRTIGNRCLVAQFESDKLVTRFAWTRHGLPRTES